MVGGSHEVVNAVVPCRAKLSSTPHNALAHLLPLVRGFLFQQLFRQLVLGGLSISFLFASLF